jgi:hypothetical protein
MNYGRHDYRGKTIARYKITVCSGCYEGNWDGWAPHYEAKLLSHLDALGLPHPPRQKNGFLPRD